MYSWIASINVIDDKKYSEYYYISQMNVYAVQDPKTAKLVIILCTHLIKILRWSNEEKRNLF